DSQWQRDKRRFHELRKHDERRRRDRLDRLSGNCDSTAGAAEEAGDLSKAPKNPGCGILPAAGPASDQRQRSGLLRMNTRVMVIIPALNEEKAVGEVVRATMAVLPGVPV